ncbi:MAG: oligopeptide/dipeptide ABC transporter ATP-binding protein [Gammaproteobacteria bacterium]
MTEPLVVVTGLSKTFTVKRGWLGRRPISAVRAVDDVSLTIQAGETLGCVGGSGSGKSTLGRLILRLIEADAGEIWFAGARISRLDGQAMRPLRRKMQIVFQDPLQSLNPRRTVIENVERPLLNFGVERKAARARVAELLNLVGLNPEQAHRYPHEYSGGQCQRIAIARALALEPAFLLLDEPVSALDVSIQAQILNLLKDLQKKLGLTYLFVSHDLKIVKQFSDRTVVMYRGRVLESGASEAIYREPLHPFTRDFLGTVLHLRKDSAWERAAERAEDLEDSSARASAGPGGCVYAENCAERFAPCQHIAPALAAIAEGRNVACHLHDPKIGKAHSHGELQSNAGRNASGG